jgi:hypothetical protein
MVGFCCFEAFANGFLTLQAEAVGQPAFISGEVEKLLSRSCARRS